MKSKSKSKTTIERDRQAQVRNLARNNRTDEQQLKFLEERGAGDCKEARKLRNRIDGAFMEGLHPETPKPPRRSRPVAKRRLKPASLM